MKEETTITFFASECGEFHGMGECIECTSLKEAFRHYQRFCKRFPHMVPSLEFSLHHADDPLYNEMCIRDRCSRSYLGKNYE